jgi:hypothetical protein
VRCYEELFGENMSGTWELFDLPSPPTGGKKKKKRKKGGPTKIMQWLGYFSEHHKA